MACARWRGVVFSSYESRFTLFRADGRQRVWRRASERFADINIVDRVVHGGGGGYGMDRNLLWTKNTGAFNDGILNAHRYRDEILRPIIVPST